MPFPDFKLTLLFVANSAISFLNKDIFNNDDTSFQSLDL